MTEHEFVSLVREMRATQRLRDSRPNDLDIFNSLRELQILVDRAIDEYPWRSPKLSEPS